MLDIKEIPLDFQAVVRTKVAVWLHLLILINTVLGLEHLKKGGDSLQEKLSDDSLLTLVQYRTFNYFWDEADLFRVWHVSVFMWMVYILRTI